MELGAPPPPSPRKRKRNDLCLERFTFTFLKSCVLCREICVLRLWLIRSHLKSTLFLSFSVFTPPYASNLPRIPISSWLFLICPLFYASFLFIFFSLFSRSFSPLPSFPASYCRSLSPHIFLFTLSHRQIRDAERIGSIAKEYSDVGRYADEDRCCREHDLCPNTLAPGNLDIFIQNTRTHTHTSKSRVKKKLFWK